MFVILVSPRDWGWYEIWSWFCNKRTPFWYLQCKFSKLKDRASLQVIVGTTCCSSVLTKLLISRSLEHQKHHVQIRIFFFSALNAPYVTLLFLPVVICLSLIFNLAGSPSQLIHPQTSALWKFWWILKPWNGQNIRNILLPKFPLTASW